MNTHEHRVIRSREAADLRMRSFVFFSANLHQLMPGLPYEQHGELFAEAEQYVRIATDDSLHRQWLASREFEPLYALANARPGIIATYHTGPYRLLPMWLAQQGIPLTLLVSADVEEEQGQAYKAWHQKLAKDSSGGGFGILEAEDPMVMRKMARALRQGHHLLIYVDGNMGGSGGRERAGSVIDFLAHKVHVRTGTAHIARLAKAPIYPVISLFDEICQPQFRMYPTIEPTGLTPDRERWANETMRHLYTRLEEVIRRDPMQWEGWFYVHGDMVRDGVSPTGELLRFYLPFRIKDQGFLLHKGSLTAYRLPDRLYTWLNSKVLLP